MSKLGFTIALLFAQLCAASSSAMTYRLFQGWFEQSCSTPTPLPRAEQTIYADGEITAGEADRFKQFLQRESCIRPGATVALNSPGGSVVDGIRLGSAIRAAGLRTTIARDSAQSYEPGQCFSACTLVFLGGVQRTPGPAGAVYGVHRFYTKNGTLTEGDVQQLSALILSFVREMGADPDYFTAMVQAGRDEVLALSPDDMERLKITTQEGGMQWQFVPEAGAFVARAVAVDSRGKQQTLEFACRAGPAGGRRRIVLTFKLDDAYDIAKPRKIGGLFGDEPVQRNAVVLSGAGESGMVIQKVDLTDEVRSSTNPAGQDVLSVDATPQILDLFRRSEQIILSLESRIWGRGRIVARTGNDRQQLLDYFESCR